MVLYTLAITQPKKMLGNLLAWLEKAEAHAQNKGFDPQVLLQARLAPDQFSLTRQIQSACDTAKFIGARLSGQQAPKHPDEEATLEELKTRIQAVIEYLDGFLEKDLEGAAERKFKVPMIPEGKHTVGAEYLQEFAIPNFYFHITTAYALLRHNGVSLGKRDYIGSLPLRDD